MTEFIYQDVVEILKNKIISDYNVDVTLSEESDVLALGLDSLDIMEYLFFIEEKFSIKIPDEFIENNSSLIIREMADYILERV